MTTLIVAGPAIAKDETLLTCLHRAGFETRPAQDTSTLRAELRQGRANLVLLDVGMPGEDPLSLARHVREQYDIGLMMVAPFHSLIDLVVGLEIGADDYLVLPLDEEEVALRVGAILRRRVPRDDDNPVLDIGGCRFRPGTRTLSGLAGQQRLSVMEAELLTALTSVPNRTRSREELLDMAPARGDEPFDRAIDSRVTRLRRKIGDAGGNGACIRAVRGGGYMFVTSGS